MKPPNSGDGEAAWILSDAAVADLIGSDVSRPDTVLGDEGSMLLVRHGESRSNLEQRYHGRLDSPLTERGVAQADAMGRQIATLLKGQSAEIVSSPQPRALRTAELIRERLGSTVGRVIIDNRLCEISIGQWEGLGHDEIAACASGIFDGDGRYEWCFSAPGGETYDAFAARIADFLGDIDDAPSLIVVTHGIVARVLRGLYAGLSRSVALALPIPQDRIFRLSEGGIEEIVIEDLKMPRIMTVLALPDRRLFVQFDDGISGTVEVGAQLANTTTEELPDEVLFRHVTIDDFGAVRWSTGAAIAADVLYELLTSHSVSAPKS
jgi:broad specificity phosphatase PhoE